jgi:hypothetical protein
MTSPSQEQRSRGITRCLVLAAGALASAAYVEVALPKRQDIASVWVLLAHLVPFVFGAELVASLRPEWFRRWRLAELTQVATFVVVFCYFVPRMFDRFIATDFDAFYYLMLTLMPLLILAFALHHRLGGGKAATVRRAAYASILVMLSGAEDAMFWILRGRPIPDQWFWASHINVFFGHVVSKGTAFAFMGVHLVLAALVLFLPDRFWTALRPRRRTPRGNAPTSPATVTEPNDRTRTTAGRSLDAS